MAKHKKTLEQKKLADMRHQVYSLDNYIKESFIQKSPLETQSYVASTSYLKHDIFKTAIISFSILASQVVLNIALRNHILKLPLVSY